MKKLIVNEKFIENAQNMGVIHFIVDGCHCFFQKKDMEPVMKSHQSRSTWQVILETAKGSGEFMLLLWDECVDYKDMDKHIPNKSRNGNPYVGFLYAPVKGGADNRKALSKWKQVAAFRYPRLVDALRLLSGIFTDCGLGVDTILTGKVKYDDLWDYVKAWYDKSEVGHPYELPKDDLDWMGFSSDDDDECPFDDAFDVGDLFS